MYSVDKKEVADIVWLQYPFAEDQTFSLDMATICIPIIVN